MYNPESLLENETHKQLWDFETETDNLLSARRTDLIIINKIKKKRTCRNVDFPGWPQRIFKEREKMDKFLDLAKEVKKLRNMKVTVIPIVIGTVRTVTKGLVREL